MIPYTFSNIQTSVLQRKRSRLLVQWGSENQICVQFTNPARIAETSDPQKEYIPAIIHIVMQLQYISRHKIHLDNEAFKRNLDQIIFRVHI